MSDSDDFDAALAEAVQEVQAVMANVGADAEQVVHFLVYERADLVQRLAYPAAPRWWWCRRRDLHWSDTPRFMRGGDEFGNATVAVRLLFGQLVVATTVPLKRIVEPASRPVPEEAA